MTLIATPPGQANNMRFQWLMSAIYNARTTRTARHLMTAAVGHSPIVDSLTRRLLGKLHAEPLKALRMLERGGGDEDIRGRHFLMEGFVCLADFYSLLEMALALNLSPWPVRQTVKNEAVLFMAQERFSYFYRERYRSPLILSLQKRLQDGNPPSDKSATPIETAAFHGLLSLRCHLAGDRDLRMYLYSLPPFHNPDKKEENRFLGHRGGRDFNATRRGFWRLLGGARELAELKFVAANTRIPALVDTFCLPWIETLREKRMALLDEAIADVETEFHGDILSLEQHEDLRASVRADITHILTPWLGEHPK